jgi:hypothetical protein
MTNIVNDKRRQRNQKLVSKYFRCPDLHEPDLHATKLNDADLIYGNYIEACRPRALK